MTERPMSVGVLRATMRRLFANYKITEGCSCCRDSEKYDKIDAEIAKLLKARPFDDGSGYDWSLYRGK